MTSPALHVPSCVGTDRNARGDGILVSMFPYAAVWAVVVAVLLAAGLFATMLHTRRPQEGWRARMRDVLASEDANGTAGVGPVEATGAAGVIAEHRAAAHDDGVGIAEFFSQAEDASGYVHLPQRYEARLEEIATALTDRVRAGRSDD